MRTASRLLTVFLLSLGFSSAALSATYTYRITEVKASVGSLVGLAINNSGYVTGSAWQCGTCQSQAFLWTGDKAVSYFGPLVKVDESDGEHYFVSADVNYAGQVTGDANTSSSSQAFLWDGATKVFIGNG